MANEMNEGLILDDETSEDEEITELLKIVEETKMSIDDFISSGKKEQGEGSRKKSGSPATRMPLEEEFLNEPESEALSLDLIEEELEKEEISRFEESVGGERGNDRTFRDFVQGSQAEEGMKQDIKTESLPNEKELQSFLKEINAQSHAKEVETSGPVGAEAISGSAEFRDEAQGSTTEKIISGPGKEELSEAFFERVHPRPANFDRHVEELIDKGVQEMMEGFKGSIRKVLPEMTRSILNLAMERIQALAKEVIPDLAEKTIQAEIKRMKQGDKD